MAATPHGRTGSVTAGRYHVEVGSDHGLALAPRDAPADDGAVRAALEHAEDSPPPPQLEGVVDSATEVTARCEEAADLAEAVLSGGILDLGEALARADVLLELVGRLDRGGRHEDALRLARVLVRLLTLLQRWAGLAHTLHAGLRAAEALGDRAAEALFRHDLGTLDLVAGRLPEADDQLEAARELRARIGDRRGLAATERAAALLCRRLREQLHEDRGTRPRRRWRRAALALALLLLGLVTGLAIGARDDPPARADDTPTPTATATATATAQPAEFTVDVTTAGDGRVTGPELDCGDDCRARRPAGSDLALTAAPGAGQHLERWEGDCTGEDEVCTQPVTRDLRVAAFFATDEPVPAIIRASVSSDGATLDACSPSCEAEIGSTVRIEASVEDGFYVDHWTGCTRSERARCEVDVTGDAEVVAVIQQSVE